MDLSVLLCMRPIFVVGCDHTFVACIWEVSFMQPINSSHSLPFFQAKMGYKEGEGLGKDGSGRVAPVEASRQRGRRGLGLIQEGFEAADDLTWEAEGEQVRSMNYELGVHL